MECARRAISEPLWQQSVDSTASLCMVSRTVRNDAVESMVCRHGGSQIARARISCERVFAWSAC
eukprot:11162601-Lingulodinium_polyedra.AAC.1